MINVLLNSDGTVKKVKARFVACGYSQVPGEDFDKTTAPTLPGPCCRLFVSIVAEEGLETDSIDAVKAFTQASVDKELHCNMPEGFGVPGHILLLRKALEGIKQGAALWFAKNKWAWSKCGLAADTCEPNLYVHSSLPVIAAVFADDVGAAYDGSLNESI